MRWKIGWRVGHRNASVVFEEVAGTGRGTVSLRWHIAGVGDERVIFFLLWHVIGLDMIDYEVGT